MNPIGCNSEQLQNIMTFCGYHNLTISDEKKLFFTDNNKKITKKIINKNKDKKFNKKNIKNKTNRDPNSPFAVLEKLL